MNNSHIACCIPASKCWPPCSPEARITAQTQEPLNHALQIPVGMSSNSRGSIP